MASIWKISASTSHHGVQQEWHPSRNDAKIMIRPFADLWGVRVKDVSIKRYDIELSSVAFARFLSIHAASDNG